MVYKLVIPFIPNESSFGWSKLFGLMWWVNDKISSDVDPISTGQAKEIRPGIRPTDKDWMNFDRKMEDKKSCFSLNLLQTIPLQKHKTYLAWNFLRFCVRCQIGSKLYKFWSFYPQIFQVVVIVCSTISVNQKLTSGDFCRAQKLMEQYGFVSCEPGCDRLPKGVTGFRDIKEWRQTLFRTICFSPF